MLYFVLRNPWCESQTRPCPIYVCLHSVWTVGFIKRSRLGTFRYGTIKRNMHYNAKRSPIQMRLLHCLTLVILSSLSTMLHKLLTKQNRVDSYRSLTLTAVVNR